MRAPVSAKGIYILTTGPYGVTTGLIAQHKSATVRSQLSHDRRRPSFTASRCSAKGLRLALHRRLSRECDQTRAGVQHAASVSSNGHAAACERSPTFRELQSLARARNLVLSLKTTGPLYTIECRDGHTDGVLVATTNGFTVPVLNLMHCDTMQIFSSRLAKADKERVFGGGLFGLGLLVVAAIMSHGHACGCTKAEMLAINDNDYQHRRLVKYYTRLGFQYVREVGNNGLADLPDLLVWGGAGTRMNCNPEALLRQWFPLLQRMSKSG